MANDYTGMRLFGFEIRKAPQEKNSLPVSSDTGGGLFCYSPYMSVGELLSNTTVCACVQIISDAVAVLPCTVYRKTGSGRERATNSSLFALLRRKPNPDDTAFSFFQQILMHLLLRGNAFIFIQRAGGMDPTIDALYALDPDCVRIRRDAQTRQVYYVYTVDGISYKYLQDTVLHIPAIRYNRLRGLSPLEYAHHTALSGLKLDNYADDYFDNGIQSKLLVTVPQEYKNWRKEDSDELITRILKAYGGRENAKKPFILNKGMAAEALDIKSNADSQLIEQRAYSEKEIAKIYRVPLFMLGKDDGKFSNNEQQNTFFLQNTLTPWLVRLQQYFNQLLPASGDQYVEFDTNAMLRSDLRTRIDAYIKGLTNGIYSPNDIREKENMPLLPDEIGGLPFLPVNLMQMTKENLAAYMAEQKQKLMQTEGVDNGSKEK